jgi:hypothetical protein
MRRSKSRSAQAFSDEFDASSQKMIRKRLLNFVRQWRNFIDLKKALKSELIRGNSKTP